MALEVQVTLACDHYQPCSGRITVTATLRGKNKDKARLRLPYTVTGGWVITHAERGYGGDPSEDFICYCPNHADRSSY